MHILEFGNNPYTRHTFWSCLIRCANMKWIRLVSWKIQSGHGFVHRRTDRRTDGRTDARKTWNQFPPFKFVETGGIISCHSITRSINSLDVYMVNNFICFLVICWTSHNGSLWLVLPRRLEVNCFLWLWAANCWFIQIRRDHQASAEACEMKRSYKHWF